MIKKTIEILSEYTSYENLRRGICFFLSQEHRAPSPHHASMPPESRTLRKISDILKSDITILGTYEHNSRMYFGARLADRRSTVFFATSWAGVDAFIKSKKTLRQLLLESTDVWVDPMPQLDPNFLPSVVDQIEFADLLYRDIPSRLRINIL
jgi:hypothetical protein